MNLSTCVVRALKGVTIVLEVISSHPPSNIYVMHRTRTTVTSPNVKYMTGREFIVVVIVSKGTELNIVDINLCINK